MTAPGRDPWGSRRKDVEASRPRLRTTLGGLAAAALLVVVALWILLAFDRSNRAFDCLASGHTACVPQPPWP